MNEDARLEALRHPSGKSNRFGSKVLPKDEKAKILENDVEPQKVPKRPFLKRGSGLYRFYKDGQCSSAERVKYKPRISRENGTVENQRANVELQQAEGQLGRPLKGLGQPVIETPKRVLKTVHFKNDAQSPEHSFMSQARKDELEDLRVFEALEKATGASSFCSTSSLAARFVQMDRPEDVLENRKWSGDSVGSDDELFSSDSMANSDDDMKSDNDDDVIVIEDEDISLLKTHASNLLKNFEPKRTTHVEQKLKKPTLEAANASQDVAQQSRIKYLEEKLEKMTLEWWSYKEQMVDVFHGMQSRLAKIEVEHEAMQHLLLEKVSLLETEVRSKSQNWCENYVEVSEKTQMLEDEQNHATKKWDNCAKQFQKDIDEIHLEISRKFTEMAEAVEDVKEKYQNSKIQTKAATSSTDHEDLDPVINLAEPRPPANFDRKNGPPEVDKGVPKVSQNGDTEISYANGTKKIIPKDEAEVRHLYTNGDIRVLLKDGTIKYFYADSGTWHTTYCNGVEFFEFSNGQTERKNLNGVIETVYPNGCVKYTHPTGTEECIFADNTVLRISPNGEKEIVLPNGQTEIHSADFKKRVYPDGTCKIVYNDGSQETRYPNGRVRIKNDKGELLADVSVKSGTKT